ncbi:MAG TPA: phasin family protein [Geminicoccaceae bacterium]|nr:phasin family protein [Geminicoccaceae bacterium]
MAKAKPVPFMPFDTDTFMAAQQRNIDALASASQIVVDGVKTIAQRQGEMMQSSVDQLMNASQDVLSLKATDLQAADHFAKAKAQYEVAINNAKELAEIAMKAQGDAVAVLSKCVMANIDDLKALSKSV